MRWVWRAESGAFKAEYGALVLLVAAIIGAIMFVGLPTDVGNLYTTALCRVDPDAENCASESNEDDSTAEETGEPDGDTEDGEEDSETSEDDSFDEDAYADVVAAENALYDAEDELAAAEGDVEESGYDEVYDELLAVVADVVGLTDAKACLTEGDIIACLTSIAGFTPWGKGAKLLKNTPKILRLWGKFRRAKSAKQAAEETADRARGAVTTRRTELDNAVDRCGGSGRRNSFAAGTPVVMGDGSLIAIEDVSVGDEVWAFDPLTGDEGPRVVTDTITGAGNKDLVDVTTATAGGAAQTTTSTADHPFWSPDSAQWLSASELAPGDRLRGLDGTWPVVTDVELRASTEAEVFNLTVSDLHTYYAGDSLLNHNQNTPNGDACQRPPDSPSTQQVDSLKDGIVSEFDDAVVTQAKSGWNIKVPISKRKNVTIRVMQGSEGNVREGQNYYRVSLDGKGALDKNGNPTSDRGASHIEMGEGSQAEIAAIIRSLKK